MSQELLGLCIGKNHRLFEGVRNAFLTPTKIECEDTAGTTFDALQALVSTQYAVCLISDEFSETDLISFLTDVAQLTNEPPCMTILVQSKPLAPPFAARVTALGLHLITSTACTPDECEKIKKKWREVRAIVSVASRIANVDHLLERVLSDIDQAAEDRKRGVDVPLRSVVSDFITEESLDLEGPSLERFFTALSEKSETAKPVEPVVFTISEKVLEKQLPELSDQGYGGVSRRVFKRLKKKFARVSVKPPSTVP